MSATTGPGGDTRIASSSADRLVRRIIGTQTKPMALSRLYIRARLARNETHVKKQWDYERGESPSCLFGVRGFTEF